MATRVMLELKYMHTTEVTIHVDAKLRVNSGSGYASSDWYPDKNPLTPIGAKLAESLSTMNMHGMYAAYGFMIQVPPIFDIIDVLWEVLQKVRTVLDDDILFATTLGDDAFTKPEFILNSDRQAFDENINTMLVELRERKRREIVEAERTFGRLAQLLDEARR